MSVFQAFRSLPVARALHRLDALPARAGAYARDTITLGWEERLKARARRMSDGGAEFGSVLARGTMLRDGDCFVLDQLQIVVTVVARAEPVFVIAPGTPEEWGRYAYQIGNNHLPVMIEDGLLVCPDVPGMEQVLALHDIAFSRASRPFTPLAGLPDHRHA
jgi:urease accessory protein